MKYHFNLHLISLAFSLYSYGCAYWLVKKEKKQAIVEVKKRNEQLYPSLHGSHFIFHMPGSTSLETSLQVHMRIYTTCDSMKSFSVLVIC